VLRPLGDVQLELLIAARVTQKRLIGTAPSKAVYDGFTACASNAA
jgi:hypothetical protein